MKNSIYLIAILSISIVALACGQDSVEWPDTPGQGGECGAWYPGGAADAGAEDTDTEDVYGIDEGDIFPCYVWESVRLAGEDTYLNVGEEYLQIKHGFSDKKALIIPVSARS